MRVGCQPVDRRLLDEQLLQGSGSALHQEEAPLGIDEKGSIASRALGQSLDPGRRHRLLQTPGVTAILADENLTAQSTGVSGWWSKRRRGLTAPLSRE